MNEAKHGRMGPGTRPGGSRTRCGRTPIRRITRLFVGLLAGAAVFGGCFTDEPIREPQPLVDTSPFRYPVDLWDAGVEGETILMIHVTPLGEVDSAYVFESSGQASFDSAAISGAYELRFTPGRRGDERVGMWAKLPVRFTRDDTSSSALPPGAPPR